MKPTGILSACLILLTCGNAVRAQQVAPQATQVSPAGKAELDLADPGSADEGKVKLDDGAPVPAPREDDLVPVREEKLTLTGLEGLPKEKLASIERNISEVASCLQGPRMQEALALLFDTAELIGKDYFLVENMRGAVYTKMRDFAHAREHFQKAIDLTTNLPEEGFHPRFNLAEVEFVEGNYEKAIERFSKLLELDIEAAKSTRRLMEFKIMLSRLKLGQRAEAEEAAAKFDPLDNDSPAYYFAQAALCYDKDDREEGDGWLLSARRIYPQPLNDVYKDSLVEAGWIQTLQ